MTNIESVQLVPNWMEVCDFNDWQRDRIRGLDPEFHDLEQNNFNIISEYLVSEVGVTPENLKAWFFRKSLFDGAEMLPVDILKLGDGFDKVMDLAERQLRNRRFDLNPNDAQDETVMHLRSGTLKSTTRVTRIFDQAFHKNGLTYPLGLKTRATLLEAKDEDPLELRLVKSGPLKEHRVTSVDDGRRNMLVVLFVEGVLARTALISSLESDVEIPSHETLVPSDFSPPPSISEIEYVGARVRWLSENGKLDLVLNTEN